MENNFYGSIDVTLLGQIVRQQPDLARNVQMKDGTTHMFVNIDVYAKEQPDQFGNIASIKVSCKKEQRREGTKYYIANLKKSQFGEQQTQQQPPTPPQPTKPADDGLPF